MLDRPRVTARGSSGHGRWRAAPEAPSRIAAALGVHRSTIATDLKQLMPLATPCAGCKVLRPRAWGAEEEGGEAVTTTPMWSSPK
jgi:hypothetical protein